MRELVAFPVVVLTVILQSAVISQISLLSGFGDLTLVVVVAWALQDGVTTAFHWAVLAAMLTSLVSGLPWIATLAGLLAGVVLAQALQRRIWRAPLLAMFAVTFIGSLTTQSISYLTLSALAVPLPFNESFTRVVLPGLLMSLLFSVPVFWIMRDLARWVNPVLETE